MQEMEEQCWTEVPKSGGEAYIITMVTGTIQCHRLSSLQIVLTKNVNNSVSTPDTAKGSAHA